MTRSPLICVVDDDQAVCSATTQLLEAHGYRVAYFTMAEEFLAKFDEADTDCILTDLTMPDMDGYELCRRLKDQGSRVAVIVMTGFADALTAVRLLKDGIVTVLEKPYRADRLIAAVDEAIQATHRLRSQ